jgi:putative transposase
MVKPAAKRQAAQELVTRRKLSRRRACGLVGLNRSTFEYRSRRRQPIELLAKIRERAQERPRFGYRRLRIMILRDGEKVSISRFYRLYRGLELSLRKRPRRRIKRLPRGPRLPSTSPNERWSMDFVFDTLVDGRPMRMLVVVDDCTRECLAIEVGDVVTSERVVRVLDRLVDQRSLPKSIVVDNGPEFTAVRTLRWSAQRNVVLDFIQPGKPTQNAYVESFNGRLRDECLTQHDFLSLQHAEDLLDDWRQDYNRVRPHSSLGGRSPEVYASELTASVPPLGAELNTVPATEPCA